MQKQSLLSEIIKKMFLSVIDKNINKFIYVFVVSSLLMVIGLFSGAAVALAATASRTTGVAPLSVFFDAIDPANGVVQPPADGNGHVEYADFNYEWNFGDSSAGGWVANGKSKNTADGYVAAHVYDNPGTYTVTLKVTDTVGQTHTYTEQIAVQNPDEVYSGTNTICISASGNFTDAPAGSLHVTTNNILDMQNYIATGRRILLRRGDSWTTASYFYVNNIPGPVTIGAYGAGINPDNRGIYDNAPIINLTDLTEQVGLPNLRSVSDLRIMDLHYIGLNGRNCFLSGCTDMFAVLCYRLKSEGFADPLVTSHWDTDGHDQFTVVDCDLSGGQDVVLFCGSERLAIMGNHLYNASQTHVLRVWHSWKGVISNNDISGSSANNASMGRHALKFHGPTEDMINRTDEARLKHRTQYSIVSNNVFGTSGPWPVVLAPESNAWDERLWDIVLENNRFLSDYGDSPRAVGMSLRISARYVTVRNNIFDATGADIDYVAINIDRDGVEPPPFGVRVFNNTIYRPNDMVKSGCASFCGVNIGSLCDITIVRNNLIVHEGPVSYGLNMVLGGGANLTADHNLVYAGSMLADPANSQPLLRSFDLQAGATAIDSGTSVPVFKDFAERLRPQGTTYDLGAFEYPSGAPPSDTQAPSIPLNLIAVSVSATQINLSWLASTDNIGVIGYEVYRDGALISSRMVTSYSNTGLSAGTNYSYQVLAYDYTGNKSGLSASATAKTFSQTDALAGGRILVLPNPYQPGTNGPQDRKNGMVFVGLPSECVINIFSLAGELVFTHTKNDPNGIFEWSAANNQGRAVASGVYIYSIKESSGRLISKGRLAIIR